jgi:tRNA(Ile)-lysidine synthase TilS/MesJ
LISLAHLKQALAPLESFGKNESTFQINGLDITIRPLLPVEETFIQKYASNILKENTDQDNPEQDNNMTRAAALDYFDRFRVEVLSYSIVQIGDLDLRNEKLVSTGETLENGVEVKVPKNVALRNIILEGWSRNALTLAFESYGSLVESIQSDLEKITKKSTEDLDLEINRLEEKLVEAKIERQKRTDLNPSVYKEQIENLLNAGDLMRKENEAARKELEKQTRESVIPESSPPPGPPVATETQVQTPDFGADSVRLPPQNLSNRGRGQSQAVKPELNPTPKGEVNPNFRLNRG